MYKYLVPERKLDYLAIQEAYDKGATILIPHSVNKQCVIEAIEHYGYNNIPVEYWDEFKMEHDKDNFIIKKPTIYMYADDILKEAVGGFNYNKLYNAESQESMYMSWEN